MVDAINAKVEERVHFGALWCGHRPFLTRTSLFRQKESSFQTPPLNSEGRWSRQNVKALMHNKL